MPPTFQAPSHSPVLVNNDFNSTLSPTEKRENLTAYPSRSPVLSPPDKDDEPCSGYGTSYDPGSKSAKQTKSMKNSKSNHHPTLQPSKCGNPSSNMPSSPPPFDGSKKSSKIAKNSKSSKANTNSHPPTVYQTSKSSKADVNSYPPTAPQSSKSSKSGVSHHLPTAQQSTKSSKADTSPYSSPAPNSRGMPVYSHNTLNPTTIDKKQDLATKSSKNTKTNKPSNTIQESTTPPTEYSSKATKKN